MSLVQRTQNNPKQLLWHERFDQEVIHPGLDTQSLVFGKGIGELGWAVMADTAPKEISGLSGGLFNMFGNISGIVTPIAIGYIVGTTGSFNGALIYVGVHALVAVLSYLVLVGDIKRIELKPVAGQSS